MTKKYLHKYKKQHEVIRQEFTKQAPNWGKNDIPPHLQWIADHLDLGPSWEVLDVAAGTGLLSRTIAPRVKRVVAVDITPEMLAQGRAEASRNGITNIQFEQGTAEALLYPSASFDMVVTRFSIHHFKNPDVVLREMSRVCRAGGKFVVIDLVSPDDPALAAQYNHWERLRDPSHTRALSIVELKQAVAKAGIAITDHYEREVEMDVHAWLDFSLTQPAARRQILDAIDRELRGGDKTGMRPFTRENKLMFMHTWGVVAGEKR